MQTVRILRVPKEGEDWPPREVVPDQLFVEATTTAPEGAHVPATLAIGEWMKYQMYCVIEVCNVSDIIF